MAAAPRRIQRYHRFTATDHFELTIILARFNRLPLTLRVSVVSIVHLRRGIESHPSSGSINNPSGADQPALAPDDRMPIERTNRNEPSPITGAMSSLLLLLWRVVAPSAIAFTARIPPNRRSVHVLLFTLSCASRVRRVNASAGLVSTLLSCLPLISSS